MDKNINIIKAARIVFADYGYKKVTMDDIAKKLDITRSALYYYYKNKEDLFNMVVRYELTLYEENIRESLRLKTTTEEKLDAFSACTADLRLKFANMYRFTMADFVDCFKTANSLKERILSLQKNIIIQILKEDIALAGVPDIEARAGLLSMALRGIVFNSTELADDLNRMCRIFYNGLCFMSREKAEGIDETL